MCGPSQPFFFSFPLIRNNSLPHRAVSRYSFSHSCGEAKLSLTSNSFWDSWLDGKAFLPAWFYLFKFREILQNRVYASCWLLHTLLSSEVFSLSISDFPDAIDMSPIFLDVPFSPPTLLFEGFFVSPLVGHEVFCPFKLSLWRRSRTQCWVRWFFPPASTNFKALPHSPLFPRNQKERSLEIKSSYRRDDGYGKLNRDWNHPVIHFPAQANGTLGSLD